MKQTDKVSTAPNPHPQNTDKD